jgi:hypothetical protein
VPFNNPVVAGDTLIRNAVQSENFTESGTLVPGQTAGSIRRNRSTNPKCKNDASGWFGGARVTGLTGIDAATGYNVPAGITMILPGITGSLLPADKLFTDSFYIQAVSACNISVSVESYLGGSFIGNVASPLLAIPAAPSWTRLYITTTGATTADEMRLLVSVDGGGVSFTVSQVLRENVALLDSYFDGDSSVSGQTTCAWEGTNGNSPSTQTLIVAGPASPSAGTGWAIRRDGTAIFNSLTTRGPAEGPSASYDNVTANNSLLYKGEELSSIFDRMPRGLVKFGQINAQVFTIPNAGANRPIIELEYPVVIGRSYRVYTNFIRNRTPTAGEVPRFIIAFTTDGSQPVLGGATTTVGSIAGTATHSSVVNRDQATQVDFVLFPPGSTTTFRVVLIIDTLAGTGCSLDLDPVKLFIEDIGIIQQSQAVARYAGATGGKTFKTFDVAATTFRSYTGTAAYDRSDLLFQGNPGGAIGNRIGWGYFPMTLITDLVGVPAADIQYLDVYVFFQHWYASSGGIAVLGYHTIGVPPAVGAIEPGGGVPNVKQVAWPGRNVGQWVTVKGTTIATALNTGTWRGLLLGRGPTNSNNYYGYANQIRLRAGYYK